MSRNAVAGSTISRLAAQIFSNTSSCVCHSRTRWWSSGSLTRSREARAPGDQHDRALLGVGPGDRVGEAQAPHAVGDADGPHAVDAGVGVGGEAAQSSRVQFTRSSGLCSSML